MLHKSSFIAAVDMGYIRVSVSVQVSLMSNTLTKQHKVWSTLRLTVAKKHLQVALKHLVACVYIVVYITHFIQKSTMIVQPFKALCVLFKI